MLALLRSGPVGFETMLTLLHSGPVGFETTLALLRSGTTGSEGILPLLRCGPDGGASGDRIRYIISSLLFELDYYDLILIF